MVVDNDLREQFYPLKTFKIDLEGCIFVASRSERNAARK